MAKTAEDISVNVSSVALRRLIEEVERDRNPATMYNRTYHRHNRS